MVKYECAILDGEEITTSYNFYKNCGGRRNSYDTPENIRGYGLGSFQIILDF